MPEETTISKLISDEKITNESIVMDALKCYVRSLPLEERMKERSVIHDFIESIGENKKLINIRPPEVGDYSQQITSRMANADTQSRLASIKKFLQFLHENELVSQDLNIPSHLRSKRIITTRKTKNKSRIIEDGPKLTRSRFKSLMSQLDKLNKQKMELAGDIQNAREDGDVRENAPLEAAREAQAMVMAKITDIENLMRGAIIIDDSAQSASKGKVNIGTKVNLKNLDNNEIHQFQLVDYHEADPLNGKISVDSPVGKIILGKSKNDKVTVKSPSGNIDYQIVSNSDR